MTRKSKTTLASPRHDMPVVKGATQARQGWRHGVLLPALASAIALYAAFPPLGWGFLAGIAPLGWLLIAERKAPVGRWGYGALWLAGCAFWLLILQGVRLAFWPLYFGWLALSFYLAVYVPLFVGLTRVLRWRWRAPLMLAAPLVWVGLELIRSYLLTGFAANTLAHSQAHYPIMIQIADQFGSGGVSFVMMSLAVAIFQLLRALHAKQWSLCLVPVSWAAVLFGATVGYGWWRLDQADRMLAESTPLLRALLIQENTPTIFEINRERNQQAWTRYLNLTREAASVHGHVDLVVWPESTFTANEPWPESNLTGDLPPELTSEKIDKSQLYAWIADLQQSFHYKTELVLAAARGKEMGGDGRETAAPQKVDWPHLLLGSDVMVCGSEKIERYNAALFVGPDGKLIDYYGKMHLVMFGEYIPLGPLLQWLGNAFGLSGLDAGTEPKCFQFKGVCVAPNICFESMMPRVLSWQVRQLVSKGKSPDVLINITNDSWFRGSSILDHHLACSMLCAVENRRPLLVAANTGLSANIDGCGRLLESSQRLQAEAILAEPVADGRWGLVQSLGYPLSWLAAVITVLAVLPVRKRIDAS